MKKKGLYPKNRIKVPSLFHKNGADSDSFLAVCCALVLWDKKLFIRIVTASIFTVRGNLCPVLFHECSSEATNRRLNRQRIIP